MKKEILSTKDKVEQFKRDCKSNDYYTKAILICNERIEELDVQLTGLGCPNGNDGIKMCIRDSHLSNLRNGK